MLNEDRLSLDDAEAMACAVHAAILHVSPDPKMELDGADAVGTRTASSSSSIGRRLLLPTIAATRRWEYAVIPHLPQGTMDILQVFTGYHMSRIPSRGALGDFVDNIPESDAVGLGIDSRSVCPLSWLQGDQR